MKIHLCLCYTGDPNQELSSCIQLIQVVLLVNEYICIPLIVEMCIYM